MRNSQRLVLQVSVSEFCHMFPRLADLFKPFANDPEYVVRFVPGFIQPESIEIGYPSDKEWTLRV